MERTSSIPHSAALIGLAEAVDPLLICTSGLRIPFMAIVLARCDDKPES